MPRGGKRQGAGRKAAWNHSETTVIRVPTVLAPKLMEIAKKLDKGESLDFVSKSNLEQAKKATQSKVKNDSTIHPKGEQLKLVTEPEELKPLSSRALGRRLEVDKNSIANRRDSDGILFEWTKELDPDDIGWRYNPSDKKYYPVENVT